AVRPDGRLAARVASRLQAMMIHRAILGVPDVVLAGPDHLDRGPGGLGGLQRLLDEVQLEAPAESAAQIGRVDLNLVRGDAADLGAESLCSGLKLGRGPDVHAVGADV